MYFKDLSPGDELEPRRVSDLRGDDMKLIAALLQDPYPPHYDRRRANELGYSGLLNQGPANCSYMLQTVVRELVSPVDLRGLDFRFHNMVFEDETVTARATVAETRVVDEEGIVVFEVALKKTNGTVVVDGTVTARVKRK
ncbi:MaoC family dehydratase [Halococcus sediminicola]|uniref:MaoC family dehydratase n=1 Tax=Halococcus sediminicola TaxID=1264579 RepID=UPI0009AD5426|nr:MaoC family dehydratase [Halococcus sediminicola]